MNSAYPSAAKRGSVRDLLHLLEDEAEREAREEGEEEGREVAGVEGKEYILQYGYQCMAERLLLLER